MGSGTGFFRLDIYRARDRRLYPVKLLWTEYGKNTSETVNREGSGTYTLKNIGETGENKGLNQDKSKMVATEEVSECVIE